MFVLINNDLTRARSPRSELSYSHVCGLFLIGILFITYWLIGQYHFIRLFELEKKTIDREVQDEALFCALASYKNVF